MQLKHAILNYERNVLCTLLQVILPVMWVILAMLIGLIGGPSLQDPPALELSTVQWLNAESSGGRSMQHHYVPYSDHSLNYGHKNGYTWYAYVQFISLKL